MTERGERSEGRRTGGRRATATLLMAAILAACTMPELATPSPEPSPTPSPSPSPTPAPSAPATTPTPMPTPDRGAIPEFAAGEIVATLTDGLRVRQRPGTQAATVAGLLPLGAELEIVMGPFLEEAFGWYLVVDIDPAEPAFDEGWIAAGHAPEPFLGSTGRTSPTSASVASLAGTGPAEDGPMEIGEGDHVVRWIAADPERIGCRFAVSLAPTGADPIPTVRATVGSGVDRGTVQPQTFDALGVRGPVFVTVDTDCDWALVIARAPALASAAPSASAAP